MSDIIIKAENLGKKYIIDHQQQGRSKYIALRDVLASSVKSLGKKLIGKHRNLKANQEEFWALKDVSFQIKQGEVVGIIGRNGAGKSTLLKILSRITEPTTGRVELKGRVASLLEVGTGFHPELTGRENIFLNGAILGMSRVEIKKKFDEIVAFAEVEKFLDTPVKRYSSGMYVRLAFAVAAHLEPEILVVDEVLAVGDAAFQKKCLGKMGDVATKEGRTVLFVSHNMGAVNRLCNQCIWLNQGKIQKIDNTNEVVQSYLSSGTSNNAQVQLPSKSHKKIQYTQISILNQNGKLTSEIFDTESVNIVLEIEVKEKVQDVYFGLIVRNSEGIDILFADSRDNNNNLRSNFNIGKYKISYSIPPYLSPGVYFITVGIAQSTSLESFDYLDTICSFNWINAKSKNRTSRLGVLNLNLPWQII